MTGYIDKIDTTHLSRFYSFSDFLVESSSPELSSSLEDYDVKSMGSGKFSMTKDNVKFQFSVLPVPKDMDAAKSIHDELLEALDSMVPYKMFAVMKKTENFPYEFGNVFNTSLSLDNVKGLMTSLSDQQKTAIQASEEEFLKSEFASLPSEIRNAVIEYLKDLISRAMIVLECLFSYAESGSKDQFYGNMDFQEILKTYNEEVAKVKENSQVKIEGPYDSEKFLNPLKSVQDYAFWKITKNGTAYVLRAPVSPKVLNDEDNVGKKTGLNFTILSDKLQEISKDFSKFPYRELKDRAENLLK